VSGATDVRTCPSAPEKRSFMTERFKEKKKKKKKHETVRKFKEAGERGTPMGIKKSAPKTSPRREKRWKINEYTQLPLNLTKTREAYQKPIKGDTLDSENRKKIKGIEDRGLVRSEA